METVVTDQSVCVTRRMKICSCLLALVLGWNATAGVIHEIVEVKTSVSLRCPHSVEDNVTWSRENNGSKVDILTAGGDKDIKHIHDPQRRFSSLVDKSLYIGKVTVSDSGRYFCNSEAAVELTVVPPGTTRLHATEGSRVTLTCPPDVKGSDVNNWSSTNIDEIKYQRGFYVSTVDRTLTITYVTLKHAGLYYCDGEPAAYLNVTKDTTTTTTTTTGTTATTLTMRSNTAEETTLGLVFGIVAFLLLLIIIIIIVYFAWRRRIKKQGHAEIYPVYEEIQDRVVFQLTKGGGSLAGPTASHCMTDFQDGSHHNDPMYSTIPDLPRVEKKSETLLSNDSTYSLIGNPLSDGINKGPSQLPENTYFLLEKPPKHGNNTDHHL